jgi:mono/diheme cytochrome c family protein
MDRELQPDQGYLALPRGRRITQWRLRAYHFGVPMTRVALIAVLLTASTGCGAAAESPPRTQQGRVFVDKFCASCHAVGKNDLSPHAAAPPFRNLDRQMDLDAFTDRLRDGLLTSHRDMPMFRFSQEDAWAVAAYIRSIQGP